MFLRFRNLDVIHSQPLKAATIWHNFLWISAALSDVTADETDGESGETL